MITLMIDTPSPFAPRKELQAFIQRMEASEYRDHPDARNAIAQVANYLQAPRPWENNDALESDTKD